MDTKKLLLFTALGVISVAVLCRFAVSYLVPGSTVTSWWRSPWHNKEVGGVSNSRHLIGWGLDVLPVTSANMAKLKSFFPVVINEGDHIHVQLV